MKEVGSFPGVHGSRRRRQCEITLPPLRRVVAERAADPLLLPRICGYFQSGRCVVWKASLSRAAEAVRSGQTLPGGMGH